MSSLEAQTAKDQASSLVVSDWEVEGQEKAELANGKDPNTKAPKNN